MLLVQTSPPLVETHTSNPAFPTGGGLGGFVFWGGAERRGHPFIGGWSHSPPVGGGGDVDDGVLCVGGEYGGGFCFSWVFYSFFIFFNDGFVLVREWCFSVLGGVCLVRVGGRSGG